MPGQHVWISRCVQTHLENQTCCHDIDMLELMVRPRKIRIIAPIYL